MSAKTMREQRHRLGIVSMLDQFLDTEHDLVKRYAMAIDLDVDVWKLEQLMLGSNSNSEQQELLSRVNLNLVMAGAGPKDTHRTEAQRLAIINEEAA